MTNNSSLPWQPDKPEKLATQFSRFGWLGFWIQLAMLAIPVALLIYLFFVSDPDSAQRRGTDLSNYLSYGSLLVMVFTTFWFYRYTRLGRRIPDSETRPPLASVVQTLWVGLWAGFLGVFFSMLLLFSAVGRFLFVLLANPQTGIQIAPGPGGDPVQSLAAIDAISLQLLIITLAAELIVLGLTIVLLFRTTRPSPQTVGEAA